MKVFVYVRPVEGKENFKGYANAIINGVQIRDLVIKEGQYGLFVDMPSRLNTKTNEYTPVVSGVSKEVKDALAEACKLALADEKHQATVGEKQGDMYFDVHYHEVNVNNLLGVASITCREKDAEKSLFTIQNVRVTEFEVEKNGKKHTVRAVSMPSKKDTSKEKTTYVDTVKFMNDKTRDFVTGLVLGKAKEQKQVEMMEPVMEEELEQPVKKTGERER